MTNSIELNGSLFSKEEMIEEIFRSKMNGLFGTIEYQERGDWKIVLSDGSIFFIYIEIPPRSNHPQVSTWTCFNKSKNVLGYGYSIREAIVASLEG